MWPSAPGSRRRRSPAWSTTPPMSARTSATGSTRRSRSWATGPMWRPARWPATGPTPSGCSRWRTNLYGPARRVFSIEQAARRHGYALALASLPDLEPQTVADGVDDLLSRGVEGLVIEMPTHATPLDLTGFADLPVVTSTERIAGLSSTGGGGRQPGRIRPGGHGLPARTGPPDRLAPGRPARLGRGRATPGRAGDRRWSRPVDRYPGRCSATGRRARATCRAASWRRGPT